MPNDWLDDLSAVSFFNLWNGIPINNPLIRGQMWWSNIKHFEMLVMNQEIIVSLFKETNIV